MRAITAFKLVACLALLGCAKADEAAAANYRPGNPTAWSVISSNPALSQVAGIMQRLGLQPALSRPFSGTLLLPTNNAIDGYMAQVELLHQENGTFADPATEQRMWSNLLEYHQLPRATSTRQKGMNVTLSTVHLDQTAAFRAALNQAAAARTLSKPGATGPFHKIHFLCSGAARVAAVTPDADAQTFKRCEVTSVRDEQNNAVTFASKNTAVLGGGVIHTINAVLQPSDVFPSLGALLDSDPRLSIISAIIKAVDEQTSCWEGPAFLKQVDCCMCGSNGTYLGNGGSCYDGMLYEATDPSYSDPYGSYGSYGGYCVANGTWVCNDIYGDPAACPSSYGPAARVAADQEVAVAQNGRSAQCRPKGTCGLENINGTFNLPLNSAFSGERVNATTGIPVDLDAARWKPIVQFHFIRANSANDFVEYRRRPGASGFPANNDRVTLLGVQRNDNRFRLRYSDAVGRLSVNYNSVNNLPQSTNIEQASIHIPPHVAHKLTDLLTPPCGNNC